MVSKEPYEARSQVEAAKPAHRREAARKISLAVFQIEGSRAAAISKMSGRAECGPGLGTILISNSFGQSFPVTNSRSPSAS